ncbi:NAD(P)-dependent oxidoreductase [bacterium]|nr:NAD(P)-dependent oxidoreductase [bacterium]
MIAITGGSGFLGFHVANYFGERGESSVLLDIASHVPADYPQDTKYISVDVRDYVLLRDALKQYDVSCIIHAAAALPLWKPKDIFSVNVDGTRNVLAAARELGIPRVVYISSTAVYGVPKIHPLLEDHPMIGVGPYGESKVQAEHLCNEAREGGQCVPTIRPKTFIGTGRLGVFQILYDWVESGCKIPVIGNGSNRYELLEVEDLCSAIYLCATLPPEKANGIFNVGAERFGTVLEDVGALCEYAGNGARVMGTPAWLVKPGLALAEALHLSPLYKWVYGTADTDSFVSIDKAKSVLGWQPQFSNAEALIRSYQWYLDHKAESDGATGITHRVAWNQGILKVFKKILH